MGMQILALACLIGAIVLGFVKKVNVGIVCLGLALILGKIGGISDGDIYAGFPYKLFCTLLGTMLFFSLLQQNGTLEKISQKLIGLCGKNTFLVPVIIYIVSYLLSAAGPGAISVQSVTVLFAVSLAVQMNASPVLMGAMAILGAVGGTASPIALTGIIVEELLLEMDITGMGMPIFLGVSLANFTCAVVTYVVLGGYKIRQAPGTAQKTVEKFDGKQIMSLIAILVMVVLVVGFAFDVGLVCLTLALILILLGAADEKKANSLSDYHYHKFDKKYDELIEQARKENPLPETTEKKRGRKKKGKILALVERLANYKAAVCLFIHNFNVPFDNNQAERDLRMIKVKTKVSGCFRTEEGARDYLKIMSYVGTAHKQGYNAYEAIRNAISGHPDFIFE